MYTTAKDEIFRNQENPQMLYKKTKKDILKTNLYKGSCKRVIFLVARLELSGHIFWGIFLSGQATRIAASLTLTDRKKEVK